MEAHLAEFGYEVDPSVIEAALNQQCERVGALLGVSPRSARVHAGDFAAVSLSQAIAGLLDEQNVATAQV